VAVGLLQPPRRNMASCILREAASALDASSKVTTDRRWGVRLNPLSHTFKHELVRRLSWAKRLWASSR
jgi:hypothetical protein